MITSWKKHLYQAFFHEVFIVIWLPKKTRLGRTDDFLGYFTDKGRLMNGEA
jgi:hypothetical protein